MNYVIEARTQFQTNVAWVAALALTLTNTSQTFTWTNSLPPSRFFRAVETTSITQPFMSMEEGQSDVVKLRLQGQLGGIYLIEGTTNLAAPISWVPVQRGTLTNANQSLSITNQQDPVRVFRVKVD